MEIQNNNNQIVEALCEIKFLPNQDWDWTIPGLFYNEIKKLYPKKREVKGFGVGFQLKHSKDNNIPNFHSNVVEKLEGLQFLNEEGNRLIYLRENSISINILKPYTSWNEFKPKILEGLKKYLEICNPKGILRIGLRYINDFKVLPPRFTIEDFFKYHPKFPDEDQATIGELIMKSSLPMPSERNFEGFLNLILKFNSPNILQQGNTSQILDLDMIFSVKEDDVIPIEKADLFIEKGHKYIIDTFNSCITDKLKNLIK